MSPKDFGFDAGVGGLGGWGVRDRVGQRHPLRQQQAKQGSHDDAARLGSNGGSRLERLHQTMVIQVGLGAVGRRSKLWARPSTQAFS